MFAQTAAVTVAAWGVCAAAEYLCCPAAGGGGCGGAVAAVGGWLRQLRGGEGVAKQRLEYAQLKSKSSGPDLSRFAGRGEHQGGAAAEVV